MNWRDLKFLKRDSTFTNIFAAPSYSRRRISDARRPIEHQGRYRSIWHKRSSVCLAGIVNLVERKIAMAHCAPYRPFLKPSPIACCNLSMASLYFSCSCKRNPNCLYASPSFESCSIRFCNLTLDTFKNPVRFLPVSNSPCSSNSS